MGAILVVVPEAEVAAARSLLAPVRKLLAVVPGGERRQDSVLEGLKQAPEGFDGIVLVHDAARPLVDVALVEAVAREAAGAGAALPVAPRGRHREARPRRPRRRDPRPRGARRGADAAGLPLRPPGRGLRSGVPRPPDPHRRGHGRRAAGRPGEVRAPAPRATARSRRPTTSPGPRASWPAWCAHEGPSGASRGGPPRRRRASTPTAWWPDGPSTWAASRCPTGAASRATPTATASSTRSATPCSARPSRATWDGTSRAATRGGAGVASRVFLEEVRRLLAGGRVRRRERRRDDHRPGAGPRPPPRADGRRARGLSSAWSGIRSRSRPRARTTSARWGGARASPRSPPRSSYKEPPART